MADEGFILHGAVVWSEGRRELHAKDKAYVICVNGICKGVFDEIPSSYADLPVEDYTDRIIVPGFTDLHVHAPQFQFRGTGMDLELIEWLQANAFPEELRFRDLTYAERAYDIFVDDIYGGATTRACVYATADAESTLMLMDMLEESGLVSFVGKVNMDRNVPEEYCESTEESLEMTLAFLEAAAEEDYQNTYPIITPRFTPSCSRELLNGLGIIAQEYDLPVQSHLSENQREITWVKELEPDCAFYGESYEKAGLFGDPSRGEKTAEAEPGYGSCIMAHCVWSPEEELALIKKNGVFIAHCPESNMNLTSGAAPVGRYLDLGLHVGLGSDVAGGTGTSIFAAMRSAVRSSKLRYKLYDETVPALTFPEVFYMATKGGGAFFGKAGSFEAGYEFDAVILEDFTFGVLEEQSAAARMERLMYCGDDRNVIGKYVRGRKLY